MVSRGVQQLKHIRLYFCDFGGSSVGVREALKSQEMADYMAENPHLRLEVNLKRNNHPYMSSTFINGYVKDQSLKNLDADEIMGWFTRVNKEFGRRPMKHNGKENLTVNRKSI